MRAEIRLRIHAPVWRQHLVQLDLERTLPRHARQYRSPNSYSPDLVAEVPTGTENFVRSEAPRRTSPPYSVTHYSSRLRQRVHDSREARKIASIVAGDASARVT